MCLAIPGQVIKVEDKKVLVSYLGNIVNPALMTDIPVRVGDFVLVQMGVIMQKIDEAAATKSQKAWSTPSSS